MGTLFDLESLRLRLERVGAPPTALDTWFARVLHGAATLTLTGTFEPFQAVAASTLCSVLAQLGRPAAAVTMIAAHAWDVVGARAVGMDTVWVTRVERCWPLPVDASPAAADLIESVRLALSSPAAAP